MEILEVGKKNVKNRNKFKCIYCGSVLIAEDKELRFVGSQYNEAIYEFDCPVCECKRTVCEFAIVKVE